jgi:hypothetical protein
VNTGHEEDVKKTGLYEGKKENKAGRQWFMLIILVNQEDRSSKPAPGKWLVRPYLKNTQH